MRPLESGELTVSSQKEGLTVKNKPVINNVPAERNIEYLVARHFSTSRYGENVEVKLGDDDKGIPDVFIFQNDELISTLELCGYIFGGIEDLRSQNIVDGVTHIDIATCTSVHEKQPPPFTVIEKKVKGNRKYEKFENKPLLLLIYSDVRSRDGKLTFASIGPMQISPSCNNFSHNRATIISDLNDVVKKHRHSQWDEIWLIDYTEYVDPVKNDPQRLDA